MIQVRIRETCSCGATIDATGGRYRSGTNPDNPRSAEEIVERWRTEHRHTETSTKQEALETEATRYPFLIDVKEFKGTAHNHSTRVPGCFRCDLSEEE